jgi:glycosyltransferase involved in cell wall biosynthesis
MKESGSAQFVFISRISPIKNLRFAMRVIAQVPGATLDIYGPCEDRAYWKTCEPLLSETIKYCGAVEHGFVVPTFAHYDYSILPSKSESYGQAIIESLSAGVPAVISDKTPWNLEDAGITIPLIESEWIRAIKWCVDCDLKTYRFMAESAYMMAYNSERQAAAIAATAQMFRKAGNNFRA